MKKNITIISDEDYDKVMDKAKKDWAYNNNTFKKIGDDFCTLGAVGENLDIYSLVSVDDSAPFKVKHGIATNVDKLYINQVTITSIKPR